MGNFQGLPIHPGIKFTICIMADLFDFSVGRMMIGVGTVGDVFGAAILFLLWGPTGLLSIWEAFDVTEQLDGFVPTNTIIAWMAHKKARSASWAPNS